MIRCRSFRKSLGGGVRVESASESLLGLGVVLSLVLSLRLGGRGFLLLPYVGDDGVVAPLLPPPISSGVKLNEIFFVAVRVRCLVSKIGLFGAIADCGGDDGVAGLIGLFGLDPVALVTDALRAMRGEPAFSSAR